MRAFIVGGYMPHGGAYMAYLLGVILHEDFCVDVHVVNLPKRESDKRVFHYPHPFESIELNELDELLTPTDLLIVNPSFSSHMFGLRLPGKKLMYIQGFQTFSLLDGFFDRYVSVSSFVADLMRITYHLDTEVIPACIMADCMPAPIPWESKSETIVIPKFKQSEVTSLLLDRFHTEYAARYENISNRCFVIEKQMPQKALWDILNEHRYLLTLTASEGFGLISLEAMACGMAVFGFDGGGGSEFMVDRENCSVARYPDLHGVVDKAHAVLSSQDEARSLAAAGIKTAQRYDFAAFRKRWHTVLKEAFF